jgi:hypothetical protein
MNSGHTAPGHYVRVTAFGSEDPQLDLAEVSGSDFDFLVLFSTDSLLDQASDRPNAVEIYGRSAPTSRP